MCIEPCAWHALLAIITRVAYYITIACYVIYSELAITN